MSKTQEKKARRLAEQQAFIKQRRTLELGMLMFNFELGKKMFEENKEKMSQEEINTLDQSMKEQAEYIAQFAQDNKIDVNEVQAQVDRAISRGEEEQPQDL